jgi:Ankyrin repeats (many copies)
VVKLRALSPARQTYCNVGYAQYDLSHLVRCVLEAVCHCCASPAPVSLSAGALLAEGISANTRGGDHDEPVLINAAQSGSESALKALLDGCANHADKRGMTAAHHAAFFGHISCLRLLLDAGAEINARDLARFTPLHLAAQEGHAECCTLLLALGCDANACTDDGATALLKAIMNQPTHACVSFFLRQTWASLSIRGGTPFTHASASETWRPSSCRCR